MPGISIDRLTHETEFQQVICYKRFRIAIAILDESWKD
ncbi:hypothetical protein CKA32_002174 [Geitlerinema sp. FC II]|nr:hypothetical protein CKA32_002174 [Geitlerinema sp. FC II]